MPTNESTDDPTLYVMPKNEIVHIEEIWAFLSVDPSDNTEGIIARTGPDGITIPMIAADAARLMSLIPEMEQTVQVTGRPIRLVKFTTRQEVRTIERKP